MRKISLTREKETLLIPLYSKALASQAERPIIVDPKAEAILGQIDYDFEELRVPRQSAVTLAMRAKKLDACVRDYLARTVRPLVLHLGCGLDSRVLRVGHREGDWYDLDFPDVIELRRHFYEEAEGYHMLPSSVTDYAWLDRVAGDGPACIVAEGLLMYLRETEVKELLVKLQRRFPGSEIAFDAYSRLTARKAGNHPSIRKTGAQIHWGIDDARQMEDWGAGMRLLEEWYFTDSEDVAGLEASFRIMFRVTGAFRAARKAHRILRFGVEALVS